MEGRPRETGVLQERTKFGARECTIGWQYRGRTRRGGKSFEVVRSMSSMQETCEKVTQPCQKPKTLIE